MSHLCKTLNIVNEKGLHARASAQFVNISEQYQSVVRVKHDDMEVIGRSIMGLLMLGATKNAQITVSVTGEDALECLTALEELVQNGFGEELAS